MKPLPIQPNRYFFILALITICTVTFILPSQSIEAQQTEFTLTSSVMEDGGILPVNYTCDGDSISPPLVWTGAPSGTTSYALLMDHQPDPDPDDYRWYWIAYNISAEVTSLEAGATVPGTLGTNVVNGKQSYAPPCSKDLSAKRYTFNLYALSAAPQFNDPASVDRATLLAGIADLTLGTATMAVTFDRSNPVSAPTDNNLVYLPLIITSPSTTVPSAETTATTTASPTAEATIMVNHDRDACATGRVFEDHKTLASITCTCRISIDRSVQEPCKSQ